MWISQSDLGVFAFCSMGVQAWAAGSKVWRRLSLPKQQGVAPSTLRTQALHPHFLLGVAPVLLWVACPPGALGLGPRRPPGTGGPSLGRGPAAVGERGAWKGQALGQKGLG